MGIQGLTKVIGDYASGSTKENEIKNYFGRKIAVDASMCIYQFLIAVRQDGSMLTNAEGETTRHGLCRAQWAGMMGVVTCSFFAATSWHHSPATELYRRCTSLKAKSHLMGMFYRTIRMIENGIKPCYVFDGKPPDMKSGELAKRKEKRDEAQKELEKAEEADDQENVDKFSKRLVKVTKQHNEECKELLKLMGVPFVDAPCEAEAQCAALVKAGKVYATGTEDMDALTFGSSVLLRHLTFSEARKMPIKEFHVEKILLEMGLSMDEFIDLCILLGCDYCDSIRGIGPKRAVDLIKQYKNIETILKHLDTKKYTVPEDWPYEKARNLFKNPEVTDPEELDLKWAEPDEAALVKYMVEDKGFTEDRIRNGCKKLTKAKNTSTQGRLDSFFKVISVTPAAKRKDADQKGSAKKKAKTGGFKKGR